MGKKRYLVLPVERLVAVVPGLDGAQGLDLLVRQVEGEDARDLGTVDRVGLDLPGVDLAGGCGRVELGLVAANEDAVLGRDHVTLHGCSHNAESGLAG